MANFSDLTRKEQVLERLKASIGQWVDGPELANETVGGSEGLKRLRELKAEGWLIQMRPHPIKARAVYQYRLAEQMRITEDPEPIAPPPPRVSAPTPIRPPRDEQSSFFGAARSKEEKFVTWTLENAVTHEFTATLWVGKQRIVGSVVEDADKTRWFWGAKIPEYKPRGYSAPLRREHRYGGIVNLPGAEGKQAAQAAVEDQVRKLREEGLPRG